MYHSGVFNWVIVTSFDVLMFTIITIISTYFGVGYDISTFP